MSRRIDLQSRAEADADHIYLWLLKRSPAGASAWYAAFAEKLESLRNLAASCSRAPEGIRLGIDLRQAIFKTRYGRSYRLIFLIADDVVRILRVRGPGQKLASRMDLSE